MIFYVSCTGNTKWAAGVLAQVTGETMVNVAEAMDGSCVFSVARGERIGFCFPVHGWRPPLLMRRFLQKMRLTAGGDNYCYALCTAGDTVGEAMDIMQKDLAGLGLHAESTFSLLMPETYVGLPFMDVDTPQKEKAKQDAARHKLDCFAGSIRQCRRGEHDVTIGRWPKINSRVIGEAFVRWIITDSKFRVDASRCVGCGMCQKVCPVGNIAIGDDGKPRWQHNGQCMACFSCYHHCHVRAIEYGRRTMGKGQYYFGKNNNKTY